MHLTIKVSCCCVSGSVMSDSLWPHGLSTEFSRQEYWSGLSFPFAGDFPNPGIEPGSPALQADSLSSEPPGKLKRGPEGGHLLAKHHNRFEYIWISTWGSQELNTAQEEHLQSEKTAPVVSLHSSTFSASGSHVHTDVLNQSYTGRTYAPVWHALNMMHSQAWEPQV